MKRLEVVALAVLALAACSPGANDAGHTGQPAVDAGLDPYKIYIEPDPSLDATTPIRRGPFLQAPSLGTVTVTWHTDDASTSRVRFGPVDGETREVSGIVFQQLATTTNVVLAGIEPQGYQHEVVLDGLEAGHSYRYTVLSASTEASATFIAAPEAGDAFRFLVIGDTRTRHDAHGQVIAAMVQTAPDARFVLNTGDLVTAGGDEASWDIFFATESPLISTVPMFAVFGNHELLLGRTIFEGLMKAPPTSTSPSETWYSADMGDVHLATIDPYALPTEPHLEWLERDLSSSHARFKIVSLHAPLFTMSKHEPEVELRGELVPILKAAGVQVVLTGHNHCYERYFGDGIHFVVTGGGGSEPYGVDMNPEADNTGASRLKAYDVLHFMVGNVDGTALRLESISVPEQASLDCFIVDTEQPGVDVPCP